MADNTKCLCGVITEHFAEQAVIFVPARPNMGVFLTVSPDTKFAGAFDDAKTYAAMFEGMTVNVFLDAETPDYSKIAFISPNLR